MISTRHVKSLFIFDLFLNQLVDNHMPLNLIDINFYKTMTACVTVNHACI